MVIPMDTNTDGITRGILPNGIVLCFCQRRTLWFISSFMNTDGITIGLIANVHSSSVNTNSVPRKPSKS